MMITAAAPRVTVAMSMHNAAPFLRECIDSVLAQTFADFEFLIVDDGSTDSSAAIAASYADPRLCIISRPHGFIESLNTLLTHARGEYIARMDADDIMLPHRLHTQVSYLDSHPDVDAVSSCATRIDATGRPTGHIGNHSDSPVAITPRMMCEANHVCNPSTMFRRSAIESRNLSYDPAFEWAEDYAFWAALIGSGGVVHRLPDTLLLYRHSQGQVTSLHYDEMMEASDRIRRHLTRRLVAEANPGYTDPQLPASPHSLTLIIPFLNEGEEVGRTVRSFLDHGGKGRVEVMVINDCSYDSYPYLDELSQIGGVTYILNSERLGVAASRDKGVALCTTPYFLLLDAHMRAYDDLWVTMLPEMLRADDRRILCCRTIPLSKGEDGDVVESPDLRPTFGARLTFSRNEIIPGIKWLSEEYSPYETTEPIPAVLGAGYAASRRYWQHIGGLAGLYHYGCDEQMISLKAWLEGGECRLLKEVRLGHIYRDVMPYATASDCMVFNSLFITETLFPTRERIRARVSARLINKERYTQAFERIDTIRQELQSARHGFPASRSFEETLSLIKRDTESDRRLAQKAIANIPEIASLLISHAQDSTDLFSGSLGHAIWLLHYASQSGDYAAHTHACSLIDRFKPSADSPLHFSKGMVGYVWTLAYLRNQQLYADAGRLEAAMDILDTYISDCELPQSQEDLTGLLAYATVASWLSADRRCKLVDSRLVAEAALRVDEVSSDSVSRYYAVLWLEIVDNPSMAIPAPALIDWIITTADIPRRARYWDLSLRDGVLSATINFLIENKINRP